VIERFTQHSDMFKCRCMDCGKHPRTAFEAQQLCSQTAQNCNGQFIRRLVNQSTTTNGLHGQAGSRTRHCMVVDVAHHSRTRRRPPTVHTSPLIACTSHAACSCTHLAPLMQTMQTDHASQVTLGWRAPSAHTRLSSDSHALINTHQ
jgi:hypothetical protein